MDNLLIWKTVLWSAPIVGIVIGGIISLYANFKIHYIETNTKAQENQNTNTYREKTLTNQGSILEINEFTKEKTNSISVQLKENNFNFIKSTVIKLHNAQYYKSENGVTLYTSTISGIKRYIHFHRDQNGKAYIAFKL